MTAPSSSNVQAAQAGLVLAMAPDLEAAFARLDVSQLKQSLPAYQLLVAAITRRYSLAAGALSARFYQDRRAATGISGRFAVTPADPTPVEQVAKTVDWATHPLWSATPDVVAAQRNVSAAVENLVMDTGRFTIIENSAKDPKARGWARIPEPGACAFCVLLSIRGAVYTGETGAFKSHDGCRCHVEPIFGKYEPSAQLREWESQYNTATRGVYGMKNLQRAWRQAYEGRSPSK